jgi:uncharacterized integral membrane protein (TIGR00698 family)
MNIAAIRQPFPPVFAAIAARLPGLSVAFALAGAAWMLRALPGLAALSPSILAILLGIAARQMLGSLAVLRPGLAFAVRPVLRAAVVMLGFQLTLGQVAALGWGALLAVAGGLLGCFLGTVWLGRRLGVEPRLARLIAAGTSVCGASAVVASNSVVRGEEGDVAYAMAAVTVFGTIAMLATPAAALALGLDATTAGLWTGASIHEVAQVVGAATQLGEQGLQTATVAKMARILMLAPLVLSLAAVARRGADRSEARAKVPVPWFVFGFLALAAASSAGLVPAAVVKPAASVTGFMLAMALGAMGFGVELRDLRRKGLRPLVLAASSWLLIAGLSLGLVKLLA